MWLSVHQQVMRVWIRGGMRMCVFDRSTINCQPSTVNCHPPGRAAQRLQEVVDQPDLEAMTVHRLLGYKGLGGGKEERQRGMEEEAAGGGQRAELMATTSDRREGGSSGVGNESHAPWGESASYEELSQVCEI